MIIYFIIEDLLKHYLQKKFHTLRLDMKSKQIKNLLSEIESLSNNLTNYIRNSERDFLRNRKLSLFTIIKSII